jgi:tetratricopeptide (TPR) repeat protein
VPFAATLALALLLLQAPAQTPEDFRAAFNRGLEALSAQQFDAAEASFRDAQRLQPRNPLVYFHLAQIHMQRGAFEQAIAELRQAIAIQPQEPQFYFRLAVLQAQLQRFHDAQQTVLALLRVRPGYPSGYLLQGRIAQEQEDHETAERHLRRFLQIRPGDAEGMWRLGATLVSREKYREAESLLKRALRNDSNLGPAHYNLGVLYARRGKDAQAKAHLEPAARLMPGNSKPFYELGIVLSRLEDLAGAELALRKALEILPDYSPAHYALATLLRRSGREQEATASLAEYERLSKAMLDDRERTRRLNSFHVEAKGLLEQDRLVEADAKLDEILAMDPKNDLAHYRKGQIAYLRQDYATAVTQAREAIRAKSFEPAYHLLEGMCLERMQQNEPAAEAYQRVLNLADYSEAHVALARLALRRNDAKQAVEHVRRAVALEPKDPDLRLTLADVLAMAGDEAGSRRERARAQALRISSPQPSQ